MAFPGPHLLVLLQPHTHISTTHTNTIDPMGRFSERKACIAVLETALQQKIRTIALDDLLFGDVESSDEDDNESSDEEDDDMNVIDDLMIILQAALSHLYYAPRIALQQAPPITEFLLVRLEDRRFKQEFRMTRASFLKLCAHVAHDPVFQNNSNNPQRPITEQMMVTLKRLGCFGNGASVGMLARFFRVGEGTVELYTDRCIMAILRFKNQVLKWPTATERGEMAEEYGEVGFEGCVGVIDGSLIPLSDSPSLNGADFYSRKGFYCISTLIVITLKPDSFFSPGQYILADSAYTPTLSVVPAFKRPAHGQLTEDQHTFNFYLARHQVVIEQCIGGLKGRFQSLKGLRLRINGHKDQIRVNAWIMACAVLHNFLNNGDDFDFDDLGDESVNITGNNSSDDPEDGPTERASEAGREFREKIKAEVLEFYE
ncbi:hypothetical protein MJO29_010731 [Puccinia striiformis f. sp. tritici]|nr:hypothetical protein MJO29_010731 [Puccinia striiformis f. sp. tritici]